ncbi:MAG: FG-GAP-like repeat-containing protein, partial [Acidobacteria bacterium]|nr:FG-GAP-like repeat-containing protein [Acidobacteriota bacterium]
PGPNRIFQINNTTVIITDVTLTGGDPAFGDVQASGGAILAVGGSLTLNRVHVTGNSATFGGGVRFEGGTNHQIQNSTFSANSAINSCGGFDYRGNGGTLTVVNSTISGNTAAVDGGGFCSFGNTTLRNVTVTNNKASSTGGGIIHLSGDLNLANTIVAGNTTTSISEISFEGGTVTSAGNNLVGASTGGSTITGRPITYQASDIRDTPPMISALGMYGGPTPTHALLPGSPAINAGNNANAPAAADQRGFTRIVGGIVDLGAYEFNCSYTISPTSQPISSSGGSGTVSVTTTSACAWAATSNVSWITVTGGNIGSGNGTVSFTVQPNTGVERTGTVTIAGQTFTVTQANGCAFQLSSNEASFPAPGGAGSFNVTSNSTCPWTATTTASWITINSGASGTGNGSVTFTVQANSGPARTGTINVNGQIFTINQASGCTYTLSPTSFSATSPGGGMGSFTLNTAPGCIWIATSNTEWLQIISGGNVISAAGGTGNETITFFFTANTGAARTGTITAGGQTFTVNQAAGTVSNRTPFDFDGDGKADISVFRPENGVWNLRNSQSGFSAITFGISTDKIVPADYDGDGKTDLAIFRNGVWVLQRTTLGFFAIAFGGASDIPMPADFTGDGRAEIAIFRPGDGAWYIFNLLNNQTSSLAFGQTGDIPVASDYDGDGRADVAVYRPSDGIWYLQRSQLGFVAITFGASTDKPVPADYDGDGKTDIAVFRPDTGVWYILRSKDGFTAMQFGLSTDKLVPADYDGDGKTDIAVFRPENRTWYIQRSNLGFISIEFGNATDIPIPGVFIP